MNAQEYLKQGFGQRALWIDFVNSLEHDGRGGSTDYLREAAWRKCFLRHWKLAGAVSQRVPLASLESLRALLRAGAGKLSAAAPLSRSELRTLNTTMSMWVRQQLVQRQNGLELEDVPRQDNWRWIAAQIAKSFAQTLTASPADRIKICPDPLCRWIFYDQTKGRTRVWCNPRTCGNRNRVRRARAAIR
ncbi:MAG: CGNR zinc finger domain-containing protein [Candidatus Acidiferrum sp.]